MFTFASVDQEEISWLYNGGWVGLAHAVPCVFPSSFESMWRCPRSISTVVCVHEPGCDPPDCSGHGLCLAGRCRCHGPFWAGPACDTLDCGPANCSLHGECSACESLRGGRAWLHPWGMNIPGEYRAARQQLGGWGCFPSPAASEAQMVRAGVL